MEIHFWGSVECFGVGNCPISQQTTSLGGSKILIPMWWIYPPCSSQGCWRRSPAVKSFQLFVPSDDGAVPPNYGRAIGDLLQNRGCWPHHLRQQLSQTSHMGPSYQGRGLLASNQAEGITRPLQIVRASTGGCLWTDSQFAPLAFCYFLGIGIGQSSFKRTPHPSQTSIHVKGSYLASRKP